MEINPFPQNTLLQVTNYVTNAEIYHAKQPFFFDNNKLFWFWKPSKHKWERVDEVDIMNGLDTQLNLTGETVTGSIKNNYLEAFKRVGRLRKPKIPPKNWIQFNDTIVDINTKTTFPATPEYFITNPIPWNLGESTETPQIDKIFSEWVGDAYKQTLYEIMAYACLPEYPIHIIMCLVGSGRNGKSKFQKLLTNFIGTENTTSTELDQLLTRPFESSKLYKKLVCNLGETNFGTIKKTSLLKKLTGQDLIGFEIKNKDPFDDYNYAKIIISSNSLPISDDTTDGFYRRWLIIDFKNKFKEGKDILQDIPEVEYNNLALRCVSVLRNLLRNGEFHNQGDIERRKQRYISSSNPLPLFIDEYCERDDDYFIRYGELFKHYTKYLQDRGKRVVSKREFSKLLNFEQLEVRKSSKTVSEGVYENGLWVEGVKLSQEKAPVLNVRDVPYTSVRPLYGESKWNMEHNKHIEHTASVLMVPQEMEVCLSDCSRCGISHEFCTVILYQNKPVCTVCYNQLTIEKKGGFDAENKAD